MTSHPRFDWFAVRYYWWALDQGLREIDEGFCRLRLVADGLALKTYDYLSTLERGEVEVLVRAMVKRFHPRGSHISGDLLSPTEQAALGRKDTALFAMPFRSRSQGVRGPRSSVLRRHVREASFQLGRPLEAHRAGERFESEILGWRVQTVVTYSASPSYVQFVVDREGRYLQDGISVLSWLGVSGQSAWNMATSGHEPETAASIVEAASLFLKATPALLAE